MSPIKSKFAIKTSKVDRPIWRKKVENEKERQTDKQRKDKERKQMKYEDSKQTKKRKCINYRKNSEKERKKESCWTNLLNSSLNDYFNPFLLWQVDLVFNLKSWLGFWLELDTSLLDLNVNLWKDFSRLVLKFIEAFYLCIAADCQCVTPCILVCRGGG